MCALRNKILFSIIVPIYNVENYLESCILSVLRQKKGIWEVILVDDGSPDTSGCIADVYAEQYENITVIHKENGGLSDARNVGLVVAKGEYVLFVDSDDELLADALEKLEREILKYRPQVAFINVHWADDIGNVDIRSKSGIAQRVCCTGPEALKSEFTTGGFFAMAQGCVCERNFLIDDNLFFKKGIIHEDEQWTPRLMLAAKKVVSLPVDVYMYKLRENSITTSGDKPKRGEDIANTCEELYEIYSKIRESKLQVVALRYNAKLYLKGLSILVRCKRKRRPKIKLLFGNWCSLRTVIQSSMFIVFPLLYAYLIDYRMLRGRKNVTNKTRTL